MINLYCKYFRALFGYEGQSNDLKVVSTGNGGIEEMTEDLNSGKIMYAFIKIDDPKTSLYKYVLLNWQGEGANTVRKGICAKHLRDVEKFFPGAHCTVNARNEEEVEPQLIIDKISKVGSAYSFKAPRSDTSGPTKPIGSNYQRVNPVKEINAKERDQFWLKEEQEEKKRIEEERKRKQAERQHLEEEVKKRELFQTAERDAKTNERNSKIDRIKEAEKQAEKNEIKNHEEPQQSAEGVMNVNQSDVLRQQRNRETQDLISQRTIDARSVFEKNTSAGQMKKTPEKPIRHSILKAQAQAQNNTEIKQDVPLVQ